MFVVVRLFVVSVCVMVVWVFNFLGCGDDM